MHLLPHLVYLLCKILLQRTTSWPMVFCQMLLMNTLDGKSTARESMKYFCHTLVKVFRKQYLRRPNQVDIQRFYERAEERCFPGMFGSLDCMHWAWKNCPAAWKDQFMGKEKEPILVLEAVVSEDLWIWHSFFGLPGSLNDLNVLDSSSLFDEVSLGIAPDTSF